WAGAAPAAPEVDAMILARTIVYATLFISALLVFLPGRILARTGVSPPASLGAVGWVGAVLTCVGGALAIWCIGTFRTTTSIVARPGAGCRFRGRDRRVERPRDADQMTGRFA